LTSVGNTSNQHLRKLINFHESSELWPKLTCPTSGQKSIGTDFEIQSNTSTS